MHLIELIFLFALKLPRLHQPAVVSLVVLQVYRLCLLVVITRDSPGPLVLFFTIWRDTLYCCPGAKPGCIYDVSGLFKLLVMSPLSSFFCNTWNNQLIQTKNSASFTCMRSKALTAGKMLPYHITKDQLPAIKGNAQRIPLHLDRCFSNRFEFQTFRSRQICDNKNKINTHVTRNKWGCW